MKRINYKILIEVFSGFLIIIIVLFFVFNYNKRKEFLSDEKSTFYTLAQIESINYGVRLAPWYNYFFILNDDSIKGNYSLTGRELREKSKKEQESYINKKFFVKFNKDKPKFNELLFNTSLPDNFKNCRNEIWDKIPPLSSVCD